MSRYGMSLTSGKWLASYLDLAVCSSFGGQIRCARRPDESDHSWVHPNPNVLARGLPLVTLLALPRAVTATGGGREGDHCDARQPTLADHPYAILL
jgi:hypothetical protein